MQNVGQGSEEPRRSRSGAREMGEKSEPAGRRPEAPRGLPELPLPDAARIDRMERKDRMERIDRTDRMEGIDRIDRIDRKPGEKEAGLEAKGLDNRSQDSRGQESRSQESRGQEHKEAYTGASGGGKITLEQERMMIDHLPTVRFLARRIHERLPQHVEIEDLVSAGVLGLMDALQKFDPEKKVQFRSYAQFRIRGAILDSLRTLDWSPRDLRRKGRAVEEAIRALTTRMGRSPSESEVAGEMEMSLGEYQQLLGELKGLEIGTLHAERSEDSGEEELAYIPDRPEEDPLFQCLKGEMQARLAEAIDQLPERERLVMTLYYYEEMTMKEIGLTLGVVESRVSQIHASAVLHLRSTLGAVRGHARERKSGKTDGGKS